MCFRFHTNTRIDATVAVHDVPDTEHSLLIQFMFVVFAQLDVILHPKNFCPEKKKKKTFPLLSD